MVRAAQRSKKQFRAVSKCARRVLHASSGDDGVESGHVIGRRDRRSQPRHVEDARRNITLLSMRCARLTSFDYHADAFD